LTLDLEHDTREFCRVRVRAWITFDSVAMGLSPMGIPDIAPGAHTLRLDREGDAPLSYGFELQGGEIRLFDAPLERLPGIVLPPWPFAPYPLVS